MEFVASVTRRRRRLQPGRSQEHRRRRLVLLLRHQLAESIGITDILLHPNAQWLCALLALCAAPALAQPLYPAKTVRIIVPYPPGGGNDIVGRAYAEELTKRMGQSFIVDNRGGASTIIGAELAAKAPPDGYTLMISSGTTFAIVPNLKSKVPYDPIRDYDPVSL